jgi:hypothetical protein
MSNNINDCIGEDTIDNVIEKLMESRKEDEDLPSQETAETSISITSNMGKADVLPPSDESSSTDNNNDKKRTIDESVVDDKCDEDDDGPLPNLPLKRARTAYFIFADEKRRDVMLEVCVCAIFLLTIVHMNINNQSLPSNVRIIFSHLFFCSSHNFHTNLPTTAPGRGSCCYRESNW